MRSIKYIVECGNWKCEVSLKNAKDFESEEDRIIESCTLTYEFLFKDYDHQNVNILSILDEDGDDYFENDDDDMEFPDIIAQLITKCYKKSNEKKPTSHYFVLSELIVENASIPMLIEPIREMKELTFSENPSLRKFIKSKFKDSKIITNLD
jgi:hypothetical protein